jgi:hypothetical protein
LDIIYIFIIIKSNIFILLIITMQKTRERERERETSAGEKYHIYNNIFFFSLRIYVYINRAHISLNIY